MKVFKAFLLGAVSGLVLALAIAVGTYVSPLRQGLYLDADPEIAGLKARMDAIRERLAQDELDIAAAPQGDPRADSLKSAQAGALKEYRHRRNRMGELSRLHEKPTPAGFAPWALSLRDWILPGAGILILLPALISAAIGARRARRRPVRTARPPARKDEAAAEALASFESAVKQVALLAPTSMPSLRSRAQAASAALSVPKAEPYAKAEPPVMAEPPANAVLREDAAKASRAAVAEKKTEYLATLPKAPTAAAPQPPPAPPAETFLPPAASPEASPYEAVAAFNVEAAPGPLPGVVSPFASVIDPAFREPETSEFPLVDAGAGAVPGSTQGARPAGLETQYLDLGPGWGAPAKPVREAASPQGLSMEDEESAETDEGGSGKDAAPPGTFPPGHPDGSQENGGAQNHFMPPTTEVERVERRKAEVLKLARKGLTSSEISRRMRISQDQVDFIIRMRREKG